MPFQFCFLCPQNESRVSRGRGKTEPAQAGADLFSYRCSLVSLTRLHKEGAIPLSSKLHLSICYLTQQQRERQLQTSLKVLLPQSETQEMRHFGFHLADRKPLGSCRCSCDCHGCVRSAPGWAPAPQSFRGHPPVIFPTSCDLWDACGAAGLFAMTKESL